jgi:hypothetical protein
MEGCRLAGLPDVDVVPQPVEELRPVRLRIDGLELHPLHVGVILDPIVDRVAVDSAPLPDSSERSERAEGVQRAGVEVERLGVDVVRASAHGESISFTTRLWFVAPRLDASFPDEGPSRSRGFMRVASSSRMP